MNAKQAIRAELRDVEGEIRTLEGKKRALSTALAALNGAGAHTRRPPTHRMSGSARVRQAREQISAQPDKEWLPIELDMPTSSAHRAIDKLVDLGEVEVMEVTSRGTKVVKWITKAEPETPDPVETPDGVKRDPLPGAAKPRSQRKAKMKRVSTETRGTQILDLLRSDPLHKFSTTEIAKKTGLTNKRISTIMAYLNGKVNKTQPGKGPRAPVFFQHKPVTVVPGLGIQPRSERS